MTKKGQGLGNFDGQCGPSPKNCSEAVGMGGLSYF